MTREQVLALARAFSWTSASYASQLSIPYEERRQRFLIADTISDALFEAAKADVWDVATKEGEKV